MSMIQRVRNLTWVKGTQEGIGNRRAYNSVLLEEDGGISSEPRTLVGCIRLIVSTISSSIKSHDKSLSIGLATFCPKDCRNSIEPFLLRVEKIGWEYSTIWVLRLSSSSQSPSSFLKVTNLLWLLQFEAFTWKNLEFLSSSFSHDTLELCFYNFSSLSIYTCTSLRAFVISSVHIRSGSILYANFNLF